MPERTAGSSGASNIKPYRFKPGQSGNPSGRPKNRPQIPDLLRKIGAEKSAKGSKLTKIDLLMHRVYGHALKGESWAVQFIADRLEGKAQANLAIEHSGSMGLYSPEAAEEIALLNEVIKAGLEKGQTLGEIGAGLKADIELEEAEVSRLEAELGPGGNGGGTAQPT